MLIVLLVPVLVPGFLSISSGMPVIFFLLGCLAGGPPVVHGAGVDFMVGSHGGRVREPVLLEHLHVPILVYLLLSCFTSLILQPGPVFFVGIRDKLSKTQLVGLVQLFVAVHLLCGHHVVLDQGRHVSVLREDLPPVLFPFFLLWRLLGGGWFVPCLVFFDFLRLGQFYGWDFDWGAPQELLAGLPDGLPLAVA